MIIISETSRKKGTLVGLGLILGAAVGTIFFIFTNQVVLIAMGAGLGLVFGAMVESLTNK